MLVRYLNARFAPTSSDAALLLLRVGIGTILFLKHGWEKVSQLSLTGPADFPNLFHLGQATGFQIALFSDCICSLLIVIGLGTRWASLFSFCSLFVAWAVVHHFGFLPSMESRPGSLNPLSGEIVTLFLLPMIVLMVAGPGRYSLDALVERKSETHLEVAQS